MMKGQRKKWMLYTFIVVSIFTTTELFGQPWLTSSTGIYYSAGNVGIGTSNVGASKLKVNGEISNAIGSGGKITLYDNSGTRRNRIILGADNAGAFLQASYGNGGTDAISFRNAASAQVMTISGEDKIGIGTSSPIEKLDVNGVINGRNKIVFGNGVGTLGYIVNDKINIRGESGYGLSMGANGQNDHFYIHTDGKVGIGTLDLSGTHKLYINGTTISTEVKVKPKAAWPDYVFDESYQLPPLRSVEAYIQTNKHLPEIPSAREVAEKGIFLGEMNARLLQKVEELTLYLIDLEKRVHELETENSTSQNN